MAQELLAWRYTPETASWEFQLFVDGVPSGFYRTMRPGEENNPTRLTLPDPEDPQIMHDVVMYKAAPSP